MIFTIIKYILFLFFIFLFRIELKNFFRNSVKNDIFAAAFADVYYSLNDYDSLLANLIRILMYPLAVVKVIVKKKNKKILLKSLIFTCINCFIFYNLFCNIYNIFYNIFKTFSVLFSEKFIDDTQEFILESVDLPTTKENYSKDFKVDGVVFKKGITRQYQILQQSRNIFDPLVKVFDNLKSAAKKKAAEYNWWEDPKGIAEMTSLDRYPHSKKYYDELNAWTRSLRENNISIHTVHYLDENGWDQIRAIFVKEPGRSPKLSDIRPNKNPIKPQEGIYNLPQTNKNNDNNNYNLAFKNKKSNNNAESFDFDSYLESYKKEIDDSFKEIRTFEDSILVLRGQKDRSKYQNAKIKKEELREPNYKNVRSTKNNVNENLDFNSIDSTKKNDVINNNKDSNNDINKIKSQNTDKKEQNLNNNSEVKETSTVKKEVSNKSSKKSKKNKENKAKIENKNNVESSSTETKKHVKKTKERVNSNIDKYGVCTPEGGEDVININNKYVHNHYKGTVSKEYFARRAMKNKELREKYVINAKKDNNNNDNNDNNDNNNNNNNNNNNYVYVKSDTENRSKQRQKKW